MTNPRVHHQHRPGAPRRRRRRRQGGGDRPARRPARRRRPGRPTATASQAAAMAREAQSATGLPGGIAIPHCRSAAVSTSRRSGSPGCRPKVDFGAPDGPADLVFLIAAPDGGGAEHMKLLSSLARALVRPEFVASLRAAPVRRRGGRPGRRRGQPRPAPRPPAAPAAERRRRPSRSRSSRSPPARPASRTPTWPPTRSSWPPSAAGVDLTVETQGSSGSTPLSADTIAGADAVIFATDVGVKDRQRFAGKPVIASGVKRAINEPDKMIAEAVAAADNPNAARVEGIGGGGRRVGVRRPAASAGAPGSGRSC